MKNQSGENIYYLSLLFLLSLFIISPLFGAGYFTSHEQIYPFYRVAGVELAIQDGQFPPRVLPNMGNGFGYGFFIFYPPLAYLSVWAVFKLGFSIFTSLKLVHFLTIFLSGISMYAFTRRLSNSNPVAAAAALFYISAPYRMVDMYIRNAFAESFAYIFLPILFLGLYEIIFGKPERYRIFAAGVAGLLLTHIITAFYAAVFCIFFIVFFFREFIKEPRRLGFLLSGVFIGFLLSSFFIIPMLYHVYSGEFAISKYKMNGGHVLEYAVHFSQMIGSEFHHGQSLPDDVKGAEMPFIIGDFLLIFSLIAIINIKKVRKVAFGIPFLAAAVLGIFMMSFYFPWESVPRPFLYIQFPWRMLFFIVFFLAFFASLSFLGLAKEKYKYLPITLLAVFLFIYTKPFLIPDRFAISENQFNANALKEKFPFVGTTLGEYLPANAEKTLYYFYSRKNIIKIVSGNVRFKNAMKQGNKITVELLSVSDGVTIELPLVYYPGYKATLISSDAEALDIPVKDSQYGFCELDIPGNGLLKIYYAGTASETAGNWLTLAGLFLFLYSMLSLSRKKMTVP